MGLTGSVFSADGRTTASPGSVASVLHSGDLHPPSSDTSLLLSALPRLTPWLLSTRV